MSVLLAPTRAHVLAGISFMSAGVFLFAANDTLGKMLVGLYPVGELMVVRGFVGLAVMLPLLRRFGFPLLIRSDRPLLQLIRFALSPAEASLFFWALITLPVASVITYYQAAPIWVVAFSALLLGERVGWRRWSAVLVGFAGVVLAMHPEAAPSAGAVCALGGSVLYAGYLIATGRLASIPRSVLTAQQLVATTIYGVAIVGFEGWVWPGQRDALLMLVLGLVRWPAISASTCRSGWGRRSRSCRSNIRCCSGASCSGSCSSATFPMRPGSRGRRSLSRPGYSSWSASTGWRRDPNPAPDGPGASARRSHARSRPTPHRAA